MRVTRFHHVSENTVQIWIADPAGNTIELQQEARAE